MNRIGKYFFNIAVSLDQLLNTVTFGDPDETVSSRIGKIKRKNNGIIPKWRFIARFLDWGLEKIDKNHTIDAIEEDEGKNAIYTRKVNHDL